jgi:hypothetical protein
VKGYDPDTIETNGVVQANAIAGLRAALPHSRRQTSAKQAPRTPAETTSTGSSPVWAASG